MKPLACRGLGPLLLGLALLAPVAHAQDWPRVPLPRELRAFDMGQQVSLNGAPMRLQGFVSAAAPSQLAEHFRKSLGQPLVETTWGAQRILGRMQGEFYLSVQIEAAGQGSRGTTAVTHLLAAHDSQAQSRQEREQWLSRLPAGSRLLSLMDSQDGAKRSRHMVFTNDQGEGLNRDRLKSMLRQEGLVFEREGAAGEPGAGAALFFKGRDKEALATIHQGGGGTTTVVVNVITPSGPLP